MQSSNLVRCYQRLKRTYFLSHLPHLLGFSMKIQAVHSSAKLAPMYKAIQ